MKLFITAIMIFITTAVLAQDRITFVNKSSNFEVKSAGKMSYSGKDQAANFVSGNVEAAYIIEDNVSKIICSGKAAAKVLQVQLADNGSVVKLDCMDRNEENNAAQLKGGSTLAVEKSKLFIDKKLYSGENRMLILKSADNIEISIKE